jgi:hypothetical protein
VTAFFTMGSNIDVEKNKETRRQKTDTTGIIFRR